MKKFGLFILSILILSQAWAQDSLTLNKAISNALENNFTIQISQNTQTISHINNNWGNTGALPMLSFTGASQNSQVDYTDEPAANALQTGNTQNADYTANALQGQVALNWVLFNGFSAIITKDKLAYFEQLSDGNVQMLVENTMYSTILAYYNVMLQKQKMRVLVITQALSKDRFDYQKSLQNLGVGTTFDVLQAQNAWLQDTAQYINQQANYNNAIRDLKYIMADSSNTQFVFPNSFEPNNSSFDVDDLLKKLQSQNQQIKNKYISLNILTKDYKLAQSKYSPTLSLNAGGQYNTNTIDYGVADASGSNQTYFGNLQLQFDIYSGGMRKRAVKIAEINKHVGQLELREMLFSMQNQLLKEYDLFVTRKALYNLAQQAEKAAALNFTIAQERYKMGSISSFDYRSIQLQYSQTSIQKIESAYVNILSETTLLYLTGGIVK